VRQERLVAGLLCALERFPRDRKRGCWPTLGSFPHLEIEQCRCLAARVRSCLEQGFFEHGLLARRAVHIIVDQLREEEQDVRPRWAGFDRRDDVFEERARRRVMSRKDEGGGGINDPLDAQAGLVPGGSSDRHREQVGCDAGRAS
jgi:hypothetical protein